MDNKKKLKELLEKSEDFLSGSELSEMLGVTRASVWKYINALKDEGYDIEAVTNRGYRLSPESDVITAEGIIKELGADAEKMTIEVIRECESTNSVLKQKAASLPEGYVLIAQRQTSGRGRLGRHFYSPEKSGLYMSLLLRPSMFAVDATRITTAAAVAVCRAIEDVSGIDAEIKWVNDIFVNRKKVCGILTEGSLDMESGNIEYLILGVGINVIAPIGGFPQELSEIVGAIFDKGTRNIRNKTTAAFLKRFWEIYEKFPSNDYIDEYRKRNFVTGKKIDVIKGNITRQAFALGIDDNFGLSVRYSDGTYENLNSGEISVKLKS